SRANHSPARIRIVSPKDLMKATRNAGEKSCRTAARAAFKTIWSGPLSGKHLRNNVQPLLAQATGRSIFDEKRGRLDAAPDTRSAYGCPVPYLVRRRSDAG